MRPLNRLVEPGSWSFYTVALLSLTALVGLFRVGFDDSYREAFRSHDENFQNFQRLTDEFGTGDADFTVLLTSPDMLSRKSLDVIRSLHGAFKHEPAVDEIISLFSLRRSKRIGRYFLPLLPGPNADEEEYLRARREVSKHPLAKARLLSEDGKSSLVVVRLKQREPSLVELQVLRERFRSVLNRYCDGTEVDAGMTGIPVIRVETIRRLQSEHLVISMIGAAVSTLIAWVAFRRMAAVVLAVLPAMLGAVWTMGAVGIAGQNFNTINIVIPPLVMVIGVSDSIHLLMHFYAARSQGSSQRASIASSLRELFSACSLTALTTSCGFLSLLIADDRIISEFGLLGGVGVLLTFVSVMVFLPWLCCTRLGSTSPQSRDAFDSHRAGWTNRWLDFLQSHRRSLAAILLVVGVAMTVQVRRLKVDFHFLENLTVSSEAFRVMKSIEDSFGGAPLLQVIVEWPNGQSIRSEQGLAFLTELHAILEAGPTVAAPTSLLSLIESLPGTSSDLTDRLAELNHIPVESLRSFLHESKRSALVTANVPDAGAAQLRQPFDALKKSIAELEARFPGWNAVPTGYSIVSTYRAGSMIHDLFKGLRLEVVVIWIVITIAFRSPMLGLLSLPSNLFPLLATAVFIDAVGLRLSYSTVLALTICLGIAVDDTVHFLSRYRYECRIHRDRTIAVRHSFRHIAPVVLITTAILLGGFGVGLFCSIPTVRDFSFCACTATIFALLSELIVMPLCLLFTAAWLDARTSATTTDREACHVD